MWSQLFIITTIMTQLFRVFGVWLLLQIFDLLYNTKWEVSLLSPCVSSAKKLIRMETPTFMENLFKHLNTSLSLVFSGGWMQLQISSGAGRQEWRTDREVEKGRQRAGRESSDRPVLWDEPRKEREKRGWTRGGGEILNSNKDQKRMEENRTEPPPLLFPWQQALLLRWQYRRLSKSEREGEREASTGSA